MLKIIEITAMVLVFCAAGFALGLLFYPVFVSL
jgi:hypothetical protein